MQPPKSFTRSSVPFYLIHSSSDGLSESSLSLSSSSGRSPHRSRFNPADRTDGGQKNKTKNGGLAKDINRGRLVLTCGIQSVESGHSIAVKHPKMAIVTGEQAGFTGGHNMVAHNITTGGAGENKETSVSTFLEALLKSANSTGGQLLSVRCLFLPRVQQHQRPSDTIEAPLNIIVEPNSASRQYRIRFFQFRSSDEQKRQIRCLTDYFD